MRFNNDNKLGRFNFRRTISAPIVAQTLSVMSCGVFAMPASVAAQEATPQNDTAQQDVVVTAQRREERLQNVPVSISVLDGGSLDRSTASGVTEALRAVPGVSTLQSYQGGGTQVTIRGVTAGIALFNGSGTVGYYLDSLPFAAVRTAIAPDASAYDLQRVEVLRGPQGTLYGASALNGVVRILTEPADATRFGVKARASLAFTEGGEPSYRQDATANIPIVEDKLAIRVTAGYQREGGWIDSRVKDNFNSADVWNLRLRALAKPTDRLTIDLSAWMWRGDYGGPSTGQRFDYYDSSLRQPINNQFDTASARIAYDFDGFTLTSATSYLDYRTRSVIDSSPFIFPGVALTSDLPVRVFSEEVTLSSSGSGPWRWSVGGIYRKAREGLFQQITIINITAANLYHSKSEAGFGELTRLFDGGRFELTAGARYFHDKIDAAPRSPANAAPTIVPGTTANATTPRVVATWHPNSQSSIYASYSQGFRSGFPQSSVSALPAAKPDRLTNYEVGAKGSAFGGKLSFDASLYYIYWKDVQRSITVIVNGIPNAGTVNGSAVSGIGADASVIMRPAKGLVLNAAFGWNNLTSDKDVFTGTALLFAKGSRLNFSPKYTGSFGGNYNFPISGNLTGRLAASATYTSRQIGRVLLGSTVREGSSDNALISKASFAIESRAGWIATVYADNLGNFRDVLSPGFGSFPQYYARARPRTIGLQLEYKY